MTETQIATSPSREITARFRIVTPMFLGGADQSPADGVRPPSFKGALRFWWRALQWGRIRQECHDDAAALRKLHQQEAYLFGATADESSQGAFLLALQQDLNALRVSPAEQFHAQFGKREHSASRYLGYGLMSAYGRQAGELQRGCLDENQTFTARLHFRPDSAQDRNAIKEALCALGLLGGLGSRVRRGLGSVALESLCENGEEIWRGPQTVGEYKEKVVALLKGIDLNSAMPPYSAFSRDSRVDRLLEAKTPFAVLNEYGKAMLMYRSWGKDGKVLGMESERRFTKDHDWSKSARDCPKDFHPRRVVFGLPHNYGKGKHLAVEAEKHHRRASPLLFHVHRLSDQSFLGVSILLKAAFLPAEEGINAGGATVPAKIEWSLLTDFLDGADARGFPRFPNKCSIRPVIEAEEGALAL